LKIKEDVILKTIRSFKGLEHRLELVRQVKGVTFYNDSFATGPQPTIAAIKSFNEPETLILGGSDKGLNYDELGKVIGETKNIKAIILIGQIAGVIKKSISKFNYKGKILELGKTNMKKIVETAYQNTSNEGVVILSPAAASFDMFKNYKDRGDKFKEAVQNL
jgi:UDP-N-acetylmuramoylalanine--D-glutamate ligase